MFRFRLHRRALIALVIVALLALVALLLYPVSAPDVVLTTIRGEKVSLQSLKGRVVLVNFWAPSCAPCVHEMPMLADTYTRLHARGLEVVAVAASYDPPNIVVDYAQSRHLPFAVALDIDDGVARVFGGLRVVPSTFVIGRNGRIVQRIDGALDAAKLQQLLEYELASP